MDGIAKPLNCSFAMFYMVGVSAISIKRHATKSLPYIDLFILFLFGLKMVAHCLLYKYKQKTLVYFGSDL